MAKRAEGGGREGDSLPTLMQDWKLGLHYTVASLILSRKGRRVHPSRLGPTPKHETTSVKHIYQRGEWQAVSEVGVGNVDMVKGRCRDRCRET